jgi:hypothetical protein
MKLTNGTHPDDLAFDKLDPVVGRQNPSIRHPVVLINIEPAPLNLK